MNPETHTHTHTHTHQWLSGPAPVCLSLLKRTGQQDSDLQTGSDVMEPGAECLFFTESPTSHETEEKSRKGPQWSREEERGKEENIKEEQ